MRRKGLGYLLISMLFLFLAIYLGNKFTNDNLDKWTKEIQDVVRNKEEVALKALSTLIDNYQRNDTPDSLFASDFSSIKDHGIEIILLKNDHVIYWTENIVPFNITRDTAYNIADVYHFENGIYVTKSIEDHEFKAVSFILIQNRFPYQNDFLRNEFESEFRVPDNIEIITEKNGKDILSSEGDYLFSIAKSETENGWLEKPHANLLFAFYFVAFLFFIAFLYYYYKSFLHVFRNKLLFELTFSIDIIIIRVLLYYFRIPRLLYETELFSAQSYASSILAPSLGDLFINMIVLLIICFLLFRSIGTTVKSKRGKTILTVLSIAGISAILPLFVYIEKLIGSVIIDSRISMGLQNIFNIEFSGIIGLLSIATLLLVFFLISSKIIRVFYASFRNEFSNALMILIVLTGVFYISFSNVHAIYPVFIYIYVFVYYFYLHYEEKYPAAFTIINLIIFSFLTTYVIIKYDQQKALENQELLVEKLQQNDNPVLEFLFREIDEIVVSDPDIKSVLEKYEYGDQSDEILAGIVRQRFNNPFWENYDILITPCDSLKELMLEPEEVVINCDEYFDAMIEALGIPTGTESLWLIESNSIAKNYLGIIELEDNGSLRFYIEMYSNLIPAGLGYPELLVNKASELNPFLKSHSVAKYIDNELVYKFGNYQYSISFDNYLINNEIPTSFERNDHIHHFYVQDDKTILVVSKKASRLFDFIAPFSYLLVIFSIFLLVFLIITLDQKKFLHPEITFRRKFQISIISIVFATFLFVGFLSVFYIIKINNDKVNNILREKSHSVLIELEHKLADIEEVTPDIYPYISELLHKFSQVFFSDINLYNLDGSLIASSRPKIFNEGLISTRIEPQAYKNILINNKLLYIQQEKIGNYEYLSAYLPFRNANKDLIAILNLPYFAKQDELKTEISSFLTAFINIYIIIFMIAIIITIIISQTITKPLLLLRTKFSQLQLGKTNEKIDWLGKDEIGDLVAEYNRMIDELAYSAEMLARSERETAWREMAKQVAHEIKNPLTPMKLSIQHLKRMINDKSPDWEKQFNKISNTLIEQMDSLSTIASEFSDFAKMPVGEKEKVELCSVIKSTIELYKNIKDISIDFEINAEQPCLIRADRRQLLRAFNNLMENAIQAVEGSDNARIIISLERNADLYRVRIIDNGKGIDPQIQKKIFSPSFTTKTSGMGLGLAIVRSIIHESGGEIDFESQIGKGTTFVVDLPVLKETE